MKNGLSVPLLSFHVFTNQRTATFPAISQHSSRHYLDPKGFRIFLFKRFSYLLDPKGFGPLRAACRAQRRPPGAAIFVYQNHGRHTPHAPWTHQLRYSPRPRSGQDETLTQRHRPSSKLWLLRLKGETKKLAM